MTIGSFHPFTQAHQDFLEQLMEAIGVNVNALMANARTDTLLEESRRWLEKQKGAVSRVVPAEGNAVQMAARV